MNEVNVLLADNENFKFVKAVFAPYSGKQSYTYKTMLEVAEGDFVVVDTPSNGYQVVQVVEVVSPAEVDFDVKYSYKWLVGKLDTEAYDECVELEKKILKVVNQSKNKRAMATVKQSILDNIDNTSADEVKRLVRL